MRNKSSLLNSSKNHRGKLACWLVLVCVSTFITVKTQRWHPKQDPKAAVAESFFAVGIPSAHRGNVSYLSNTLRSLYCSFGNTSQPPHVVVVNTQLPAADHPVFEDLHNEHAQPAQFMAVPEMHEQLHHPAFVADMAARAQRELDVSYASNIRDCAIADTYLTRSRLHCHHWGLANLESPGTPLAFCGGAQKRCWTQHLCWRQQ
jgi:hypothetical protein